jgi:hypothetical protein
MIQHVCVISAVIKDEGLVRAVEGQFSNAVCRVCAFWGAPNSSCRQRLIVKRDLNSLSRVTVTCSDYEKEIGISITNKIAELEKAEQQLTTVQANIKSHLAEKQLTPSQRYVTTQRKMKALLDKFNGQSLKTIDSTLDALRIRQAETLLHIKTCSRELEELKQKQKKMGV